MAYSYHMGASMLGLRSMRNGGFRTVHSGGLPKLKSLSSVVSTKSSISSSMLMNRNSIRSAVSQIFQTDVSDSMVSSKVSSGMTKEYVAELEAQAKADAQAGVYGQDGKANALRASQMAKYVSPDRDKAIAQANKVLAGSSVLGVGTTTMKLTGLSYTISLSRGASGITAELYDENGETFATYDSKSGGWTSVATKAESQFQTASSSVYDEAYRAEAARLGGSTGSSTASGLDTRA